MIKSTEGYKTAIVGDARRILAKVILDIVGPDIVYGTAETSGQSQYSKLPQINDKRMKSPPKCATLELNRWILDGTFGVLPDNPADFTGDIGYIGDSISGDDGYFSDAPWVALKFSGVYVLQMCSVYFSENPEDGVPCDFTVEIIQGGTVYHSQTFTGNTQTKVDVEHFTVYNPDTIKVTVTRWSLPGHRFRCIEIIPGMYDEWDGGMLAALDVKMQGDVSCINLPYGTCSISIDNLDRRFEPRSKDGVFQSIEERQAIDIRLAVVRPDNVREYKRLGFFYQASGGWKTGDNGLTMKWYLVDIVGLLANREYRGDTATTLGGWVANIMAQLGENVGKRYTVDPDYADLEATVNSADDISGMTCGDLLRYVCMATGTWPRADQETGNLAVEPLWNEGNKITLENLNSYPTMSANEDIAALTIHVFYGLGGDVTIYGAAPGADTTVNIQNPFIHSTQQALSVARVVMSQYGGNKYELTGRGDMTSEIGDVDTIWLNESTATTARRIMQTFGFSSGVLQGCKSTLLQADGSFLFTERTRIIESGTWTAPAGVRKIRVILIGHGATGERGSDGSGGSVPSAPAEPTEPPSVITSFATYGPENIGSMGTSGTMGAAGAGGKVWSQTIDINEGQTFDITIGDDTTFGPYTSANGKVYPNGYTDIANGDSFARTGVANPLPGSGDGGKGGAAGKAGYGYARWVYLVADPGFPFIDGRTEGWYLFRGDTSTKGQPGVEGATGCVVIYWDKPEDEDNG